LWAGADVVLQVGLHGIQLATCRHPTDAPS
jgi:hypothetical protein